MITKKHVFQEIIRLDKFKELTNDQKIDQLYNAVVTLTKVLLNIRENQKTISRGEKIESKKQKKIKVENPVIPQDIEVK